MAQLGSAPALGAGGPGFKSRRPDFKRAGLWPALFRRSPCFVAVSRLRLETFRSNPAAPISIKSKPRSDGAETYHRGTLLCFWVPWVPPDGLGNPCGPVYIASLSTLQRHRWPITDPLRCCARL